MDLPWCAVCYNAEASKFPFGTEYDEQNPIMQ